MDQTTIIDHLQRFTILKLNQSVHYQTYQIGDGSTPRMENLYVVEEVGFMSRTTASNGMLATELKPTNYPTKELFICLGRLNVGSILCKVMLASEQSL